MRHTKPETKPRACHCLGCSLFLLRTPVVSLFAALFPLLITLLSYSLHIPISLSSSPIMSALVRYDPNSAAYNPETAVHLSNSLMHFYHNEQTWVSRTRASIELALVQGPLALPQHPHNESPESASTSSAYSSANASPPDSLPDTSSSVCALSSDYNDSSSASITSDVESSSEFAQEYDADSESIASEIRPLSVRAIADKRKSVHSRWHKRKQQFNLHLGPLSSRPPQRKRKPDVQDPGTQLLEAFGDLVNTRMQSCVRVSRMVHDANTEMATSYFGC